jgi:hypothetical protein
MANGVTFEVIDASAPRKCCAPDVRDAASQLASRAASATPRLTGRMASSWRVAPGFNDPATSVVINDAPYARFVEYGTRRTRAYAPLGRAIAGGM